MPSGNKVLEFNIEAQRESLLRLKSRPKLRIWWVLSLWMCITVLLLGGVDVFLSGFFVSQVSQTLWTHSRESTIDKALTLIEQPGREVAYVSEVLDKHFEEYNRTLVEDDIYLLYELASFIDYRIISIASGRLWNNDPANYTMVMLSWLSEVGLSAAISTTFGSYMTGYYFDQNNGTLVKPPHFSGNDIPPCMFSYVGFPYTGGVSITKPRIWDYQVLNPSWNGPRYDVIIGAVTIRQLPEYKSFAHVLYSNDGINQLIDAIIEPMPDGTIAIVVCNDWRIVGTSMPVNITGVIMNDTRTSTKPVTQPRWPLHGICLVSAVPASTTLTSNCTRDSVSRASGCLSTSASPSTAMFQILTRSCC